MPIRARYLSPTLLSSAVLAAGLAALPAHADTLEEALRSLRGAAADAPVTVLAANPQPHDHHDASHGKTDEKTPVGDLTQLSIEQLMEQEVVPINVLGGHTHPKGQYMFGYRYMAQSQIGELDGDSPISTNRILKRYTTAPTSMFMNMHMVEGMYAPSEKLTLMLMLPWSDMAMDHVSLGGHHGGGGGGGAGTGLRHRFTETSSGFGDTTVMGLYTLKGDVKKGGTRILLNGGLQLPTGTIDESMGGHRLEYNMQPGSGTFNFMPGVTYLHDQKKWSHGAQIMGTIPLGLNSNGWSRGEQVRLSAWSTYSVRDWVAPSLRLDANLWGDVHGRDRTLDPLIEPQMDPALQGGRRLDLTLGLNFYAPKGKLKGHRLTIEGGIPLYQNLDGPQLSTDWQVSVAWSYTH